MKILFFGDIVGKSGRTAVRQLLPELRKEYTPDLVIANVENVAHGKGVTKHTIQALAEVGVDFFTSGNHVFDKPEAKEVFEKYAQQIIRPANFSDDLPGRGFQIITVNDTSVQIINLNGTVFMEQQFDYGQVRNPFVELNQILESSKDAAKIRLLDFHAEATSEKRGMGLFADGRLSAVIGTHTHVQSADAQVLPEGTGYLTDVGMVGAAGSVIGVKSEAVIRRFLEGEEQSAAALQIDEGDRYEVGYCLLEIDDDTGKCQNIKAELQNFK